MTPPKKVILAAKAGRRVIPIGNTGRYWQAFNRPTHLCFTGDQIIELVAPNGDEWTLLIPLNDPQHHMVTRLDN